MKRKYHWIFNKYRLFLIATSIILGGCLADTFSSKGRPIHPIRNTQNIEDTRTQSFIRYPRPSEFSICHGHTCRYFARTGLNTGEWTKIKSVFQKEADSPSQERKQIRDAIALFESIVGKRNGTANDLGETLEGVGSPGQMDCVDEATNTTVYLTMLENADLLRWHTVEHRASRGITSFVVPHFTAVIRDIESGIEYAVDSWFLDNGQPPFIVPMDDWQAGWEPQAL